MFLFVLGASVTDLDPVNVAVVLLSYLISSAAAAILGPYAVILVASTVGAAWALGRRDPCAKLGAVAYFLRLNATAAILTVAIANGLGKWLGHDDPTWMISLIALLIGGIGDDWPKLLTWFTGLVTRKAERKANDIFGDVE